MNGHYPAHAPRIERTRHRAHETLRSADLNGQEETQDALRSWHNRALHATYGVVFGLEIGWDGQPSALRAIVKPGFAYDATGRDLLLRQPTSIPLPFDPQGMTLTLRAGAGAGGGDPVLAWYPTADFRIAWGVPVARTVDRVERTGASLRLPLPPSLSGKVEYTGEPPGLLTIRGVLTARQFADLLALADTKTANLIKSAFGGYPFDAPRQTRARGLEVSIESPESRRLPVKADDPLWLAVVSPGSAENSLGTTLTLDKETILPLDSGSDRRVLVLQPGGSLALVADEPALGASDSVVLARIGSPAADPVIALASPVQTGIPAFAATLGDLRDTKHKIAYVNGAREITVTGFFTHHESDALINMVSDNPESVGSAFAKLRNDVEGNRPVVPRVTEDLERVPLFPPRSRPLARPRIAGGSSLPGRTEWKKIDLNGVSGLLVFEATVNIESAGFIAYPQVIAWVERVQNALPLKDFSNFPAIPLPFLGGVEGSHHQGNDKRVSTRAFVFRLWQSVEAMTQLVGQVNLAALPLWLGANLYVRWLAVQSDPPPPWPQDQEGEVRR